MFRYLGLLWNEQDPGAHVTAKILIDRCHAQFPSWTLAINVPGFTVFSAGMPLVGKVVGDGNGAALVLGHLFKPVDESSDYLSAAEPGVSRHSVDWIDDEGMAEIRDSCGRELVRRYWGNYVALGCEARGETHWALRGPASAVPCLHTSHDGVELYFSWTEACARLCGGRFTTNWKYVARSLIGPSCCSDTGVVEIREILAGFCEEVHGSRRIQHRYWSPVDLVKQQPIEDFSRAANTLHAVTRQCVDAWAERTPSLLHGLSGGLDSSIVLGCLHRAPARPEITALTYFADGADSDERVFAGCAAQSAKCRHIERYRDDSDLDLRSSMTKVRLERSSGLRIPQVDRIELDLARSMGARAIYKGHGGDELFCRHHISYYVTDALRSRRPFHSGALGLLLHSAVVEGETVWATAARALTDAFFKPRWSLVDVFDNDQAGQSLLRREVWDELRTGEAASSPYACSSRECPPGKLWQISLITGWRPYFTPSVLEDDPPIISPLMSQPVMEVCLRIPTYLQLYGRRERAVARAAFEREVPREILERTSKGGSEQLAWKLFRRNLPFIRELLLDGKLVEQGIVDRQKLEMALSVSSASPLAATVPVFELVGTELWLQSWQ